MKISAIIKKFFVNGEAYYTEATKHYKADNFSDALKCLDKVLDLNDKYYLKACIYKSIILSKIGDKEEANKLYNHSININPDLTKIYYENIKLLQDELEEGYLDNNESAILLGQTM